MRFVRLLLAACFVVLAFAGAAYPTGRSVTLTDHTWRCTGPVQLDSVTVTITAAAAVKGAVLLDKGCTGTIGLITVTTWRGDGIDIGKAHSLTVGAIHIVCKGRATGAHQDGIQALGGLHVHFHGGYVGCYTANDAQAFLNGLGNPTDVVFTGVTFDPRGGGEHGLVIGHSTSSGFVNSILLTNPKAHPCSAVNATRPVWTGTSFPAGDRCP